MDIIDAQVHLNSFGSKGALGAMRALGIAGVMVDEYTGVEGEKLKPYVVAPGNVPRPVQPWAENMALNHPDQICYLIRLDYRDPDLEAIVRLASASPGAKALRICVLFPSEVEAFKADRHRRIFEIADRYQLPLFANVRQIELLAPYYGEFRNAKIIIDHCGLPVDIDFKPSDERLDVVLSLARYPNAYFKFAHAPTMLGGQQFPFTEMNSKLRRIVDAFGANRVMWASDATEAIGGYTWAESLLYIKGNPELSGEEKEWILGRTAREVLGWPIPAAAA